MAEVKKTLHRLKDQFGRFVRRLAAPSRQPLSAAPIMESSREYVMTGMTPERMGRIFREADAGDMLRQSELFNQIEERDAHIMGERGKRVNVILDADYVLEPASDDARDARVVEFVREFFDGMADWADCMTALQDAVGKGFAGMEIHWDVSEGQALPKSLEFAEQNRFRFADSAGILRRYPLWVSDNDPLGAEIPPWKVIMHMYGGKSGHPTRSGIHRVCAWMHLFKNFGFKDWLIFCEVYGMPLRLGKYDPSASREDKDALITAISTLGSDAAGIISRNTEIEFVETIRGKAGGDLYEALIRMCNGEISKALLGQTLTAEVGPVGSFAASKTHDHVRDDLKKFDSRAMAMTVRNQLIRPIVGFNFGWETAVPKYVAKWDEPEDLKAKSEWVDRLLTQGVAMPLAWVRREFGIPEPEKGEETIGQTPSGGEIPARLFPDGLVRAGGGSPGKRKISADLAARFAERLETEGAADAGAMIEPIRNLIMTASSMKEIRDGLKALNIDTDAMGERIAMAMTAALLAGRAEVDDET